MVNLDGVRNSADIEVSI